MERTRGEGKPQGRWLLYLLTGGIVLVVLLLLYLFGMIGGSRSVNTGYY